LIEKDLLASVQDVKVMTMGDDDTGAVEGGYLRIRGQFGQSKFTTLFSLSFSIREWLSF
jgi:hypothetical protein